ncbi:MAG: alpha/beta hydrolase, partial [Bacteroidia bacterium]|nr:alpha/beta hydrolase [Bacteroidia bacterium]
MTHQLKTEDRFSYIEVGEGTPIIILHGLMGGLSNFNDVVDFFGDNGYKVIIPELPLYTLSLINTNVKSFANFLNDFIEFKGFDKVILLGNSLGGHIGLY